MTYRTLLDQIKFKHSHALQTLEEESAKVEETQLAVDNLKKAVQIVQIVAQAVEQAVHSKIATVVSSCLEAVFDDPYEFKIQFDRKRSRTEATLSFVRNGLEVDPMTAAGGGAVDMATFALRVACLTLKKDLEPVLVLDEPLKFLSRDLQPRVRPLLEELSDKLGIQFIIITHMQNLRVGHVVELQHKAFGEYGT